MNARDDDVVPMMPIQKAQRLGIQIDREFVGIGNIAVQADDKRVVIVDLRGEEDAIQSEGGGVGVKPVQIVSVGSTSFIVHDLMEDGTLDPSGVDYSVNAYTRTGMGIIGTALLTDCVNVPVAGGFLLIWKVPVRTGNSGAVVTDWWTVHAFDQVCASN